MKTLIATVTALMLLGAAPAMAVSCCSGGKGKAGMCAKGGMAMNHSGMKGKRGCCCQGMGDNMSKRA